MRTNHTFWSIDELCGILKWPANAFLALGSVLFLFHLFAPLFGGRVVVNGLLVYGSWIIFALCLKWEIKGIKSKRRGWRRPILLSIVEALCMVWWFPVPYNPAAAVLFFVVKLTGYRSLLKPLEP